MWKDAEPDLRDYIGHTEHIERLEANNLQDSVDYCLTEDTVQLVPIYRKNTGKLKL
jgi:2-phosphosulfolactate phosphatase